MKSLAKQLDEALVDHIYEVVIKPATSLADQIVKQEASRVSPGRTGTRDLVNNSYAWLWRESDENEASIIVLSDPKKAPTRDGKIYSGGVDHANFLDARTKYFTNAVRRIRALF